MFIIMAGPSGVGKNTIINELIKRNANFAIHKTITTRQPRNEADKEVYTFVTREEFEQKIANGDMLEYEDVHGNWYGSEKSFFYKSIESGKTLLKDIDVKGQLSYKRILEGIVPVLSVFLTAPIDVLKERLVGRGETKEGLEKRLGRYDLELSYQPNFDVVINNLDMEQTILEIERAIQAMAEKHKK